MVLLQLHKAYKIAEIVTTWFVGSSLLLALLDLNSRVFSAAPIAFRISLVSASSSNLHARVYTESRSGAGSGFLIAAKLAMPAYMRARTHARTYVPTLCARACIRVVCPALRAMQNSFYSKHFHLGNHPMAESKVVDAHFVLESLAEDKEEHFGPIEVCL